MKKSCLTKREDLMLDMIMKKVNNLKSETQACNYQMQYYIKGQEDLIDDILEILTEKLD